MRRSLATAFAELFLNCLENIPRKRNNSYTTMDVSPLCFSPNCLSKSRFNRRKTSQIFYCFVGLPVGALPQLVILPVFDCACQLMFRARYALEKLMIVGVDLISTAFAPEFRLTKLRYFGCEVRTMPLYFAFAIDLLLAARYVKGKNRSTAADTSIAEYIVDGGDLIGIYNCSEIAKEYLCGTPFGLVAAKVTKKLVIAEMKYLDWSLLSPRLLFFNQYFNCSLGICVY
uniref:Uncharacterized protein n=1 Tax=Glossina austeni TaxID=7395 RepID=A0A1A9UZ47_GLOAU